MPGPCGSWHAPRRDRDQSRGRRSHGRFYVADTRGGAVLSFTTRPRLRLLSRVSVPGRPYGLAIDTLRDRLWVTVTATNRVDEFALYGATPRLIGAFATARQPNTIAVDTSDGRVFVAAAASAPCSSSTPLICTR